LRVAIAVFLLLASLFFFWFNAPLVAIASLALSLYLFLHRPIKSLAAETVEAMEKAEGQAPPMEVWEEGMRAAGARVGEQLFSDNDKITSLPKIRVTRFRFMPEKLGEAGKKTVGLFKKLFE
jgi:hypothetical protein